MFHTIGQCRKKISLQILCSLILVYNGGKSNYSRQVLKVLNFDRLFQSMHCALPCRLNIEEISTPTEAIVMTDKNDIVKSANTKAGSFKPSYIGFKFFAEFFREPFQVHIKDGKGEKFAMDI